MTDQTSPPASSYLSSLEQRTQTELESIASRLWSLRSIEEQQTVQEITNCDNAFLEQDMSNRNEDHQFKISVMIHIKNTSDPDDGAEYLRIKGLGQILGHYIDFAFNRYERDIADAQYQRRPQSSG